MFTEYYNLRTEIYKPRFVSEIGDVRDMSEILETLPAINLAKYFFDNSKTTIDFIKAQYGPVDVNLVQRIKNLLPGKNKAQVAKKAPRHQKKFDYNKVTVGLLYPTAILVAFAIGYNVFSNIYVNKVNEYISEYKNKTSEYQDTIKRIDSDKNEIATNANKYKTVTDRVYELKAQVENNEIGRYTTYNVASFTQKLAKITPKNVTLLFIQSDDKKHVTIGAKSNRYPDLGYLVASLRLNHDILENIEITKIVNGEEVSIEIEGDLP